MNVISQYWAKLPAVIRTTLFSAGRAFVGVFVLSEAQIATDIINRASISTDEALLVALASAGFVAAVRVIQHAIQGTLTTKTA